MPDGGHSEPVVPEGRQGPKPVPAESNDRARRRAIRELGVLVPLVVPSIMGAVILFWLR